MRICGVFPEVECCIVNLHTSFILYSGPVLFLVFYLEGVVVFSDSFR